MAVLERHYRVDILKTSFSVEELRSCSLELVEDVDGEEAPAKPDAAAALGPAFAELIDTLGKTDVSMHEYVHERQPGMGRDNCRKRRTEAAVGGKVRKVKK
jgi:hypothetical protein